MKRTGMQGMRSLAGALLLALPLAVQAQTWSKTETIEYHDDTTLWVLGQVKRTTVNGTETGKTDYGWKALPWKTYAFGKLQQTLAYDNTSGVGTGQLGTLKSVTDGNGHVTTLGSWKRGIPQSIGYADSTGQSAVVNDLGLIASVTDENGYTTCYQYDAMGRLSRLSPPGETSSGACDSAEAYWESTSRTFEPVASAEYGIAAGHWRLTEGTGRHQKVSYFDALWRPLVTREYDTANVAGTQRFSRYAYDHEGRVTFASYPGTTDALTTGTWTEYDALGRVTAASQDSELGLLTTTTVYLGDATGPYTRVTTPKGVRTVTRYQMFDQPTYEFPTLIDQAQNLAERAGIDITRDVFGKPLSIRKRDSAAVVAVTRSYTYNANQELCRAVEPETGATLMGYDAAGNLSWSAAGLAASTACDATGTTPAVVARKAARTYDARNRVTALTFPGTGQGNVSQSYTPDGLLATAAVQNYGPTGAAWPVTSTYTYNRRRLLTGETMQRSTAAAWTIDYTYNANGVLASLKYPSGLQVAYAPNALGQPTQAGTYATGVSYFPNGAMKQFTYGNGIVHTLTQNARQLPARSTDCTTTGTCAAANRRLDLSYAYDAHGNVASITDGVSGARQSRSLTYDGLDRLIQATGASFGTASYGYNVLDNLTSLKVTAGSHVRDHVYNYDASNRLTSITNTVGGATVVGLGYDVQGNLANKNGQPFLFDFGNRLREAVGQENYFYDVHGRRVQANIPTGQGIVSHYSQAGQLLYQQDYRAAKRSEYIYLGGSLMAARETPHATSVVAVKYQHTDALGTPIAVTDASKAVVESSEYEPYGQLTNRALTDGPGFTGHVQDAATGLTYMQQRYYDPQIGKFLSVDPVTAYSNPVGAFNRYWYASNNPYRFTDPDGRNGLEKLRERIFPIATELRGRGTTGSASSNATGAIKHIANSMIEAGAMAANPLTVALGIPAPKFEIKNNELEGAAAAEFMITAGSAVAGGGVGGLRSTGGKIATSVAGDLTKGEIKAIQGVVNQAGRPLEVVGSAARGARTAGSDIDYVVPPSSMPYFEGLQGKLPSIDPNHGIIPGVGNPNIGPVIRFEPFIE